MISAPTSVTLRVDCPTAPDRAANELVVTGLRKSFTTPSGTLINVLENISFDASPGQMIAIVGESGVGKSTLLNLIAGLDSADSGEIILGGVSIQNASSSELVRLRNRRIGLVFQFHHLLSVLTAVENVAMPLLISRVPYNKAIQGAFQLLSEAGLSARAEYPISHLSGGEQQRVAVLRALINRPALVLADEPTGNLDLVAGKQIGESLLTYCRKNGAICVLATHNERMAMQCDRILVLKDGKLKLDVNTSEKRE